MFAFQHYWVSGGYSPLICFNARLAEEQVLVGSLRGGAGSLRRIVDCMALSMVARTLGRRIAARGRRFPSASCPAIVGMPGRDCINVDPVKDCPIIVRLAAPMSQLPAPLVSLFDNNAKLVAGNLRTQRVGVAVTAEFIGRNGNTRVGQIAMLIAWRRAHCLSMSTR